MGHRCCAECQVGGANREGSRLYFLSMISHRCRQGYSHGALITSLHPVLPTPVKTSHLLLSYPLGPRSFLTLFHGRTYTDRLNKLINDAQSNVLIVHGDQDEFTSAETYGGWVTGLRKNEGEFRVELIQGATHFWASGAGQRLKEVVKDWVPKPA